MTTAATHHRVRRATRNRHAWMAMVGLATAFAVLVAASIAVHQSEEAARALQVRVQVAACERGNLVRAYLTAAALTPERRARAARVFPILDCVATTEAGRPVALPLPVQRAYIRSSIPPLR